MAQDGQWMTIKDAAKALQIPYQTLLRIVNLEEAKGTVEVRSSARDRRARLVNVNQVRELLSNEG